MGGKRSVPKGTYNIFSLGDMGGAQAYMSERNLIGMSRYLRGLDNSNLPNVLILGGGVMPYFPTKGSTANNNYLDTIVPKLNSILDSAIYMKPHLNRMLSLLPKETKIIYTLGDEDRKNILEIQRSLGLAYKNDMEYLEKLISDENLTVNSRVEILKGIDTSKAKFREMLAKDKNEQSKYDRDMKELQNIKVKEGINREEKKEAEERRDLLKALYTLKVQESDPSDGKFDKYLSQKKEEMSKILEEMKNVTDSDKLAELSAKSKAISNSIRVMGNKMKEKSSTNEQYKSDMRNKSVDNYTGNSLTDHRSHEIINKLSESYYLSYLKDAFGRKRKLTLQNEKVDGMIIDAGRGKFNLITAYSLNVILGARSIGSNNKIVGKLDILANNGLNAEKINPKLDNILVTSKNNNSSFTIEPYRDRSDLLTFALAQGPFTDPGKVTSKWNEWVNTKYTQSVQKGIVSNGFTILRVSDPGLPVKYETKTSDMLFELYVDEMKEQYKVLNKRWSIVKDQDIQFPLNGVSNADLEYYVAMNKLPSELKDWELKKYYPLIKAKIEDDLKASMNAERNPEARRELEMLFSQSSADVKSNNENNKLVIALINDIHISNNLLYELLEKSIEDLIKKEPDILVLGGDILDGFYKNHGAEPHINNSSYHVEKVKDILRKDSADTLNEFYKMKSEQLYFNIDEQVIFLLDKLEDLVYKIAEKGGTVITISGNHYNKTEGQGHRDESTVIANSLRQRLQGYLDGIRKAGGNAELEKNLEKAIYGITAIVGGEFGAGEKNINGLKVYLSHEMGTSIESSLVKYIMDKRPDRPGAFISGHDHIAEAGFVGPNLFVKGPSMQESDSSFMNFLPIPVGDYPKGAINGYTLIELDLDRDSRILDSSIEYVLARNLIRSDSPSAIISKANKKADNISVNYHNQGDKEKSKSRT